MLSIKKKRASRIRTYGENPFLIVNNKSFIEEDKKNPGSEE
jgi:hypothetical protein